MGLTGINWVGHIYQKYETMLLEVEEDMYQDVVNYVENQVQTVGDSVKKFYSDVMEDILPPPSADPFQAVDSDLSMEKHADVRDYKKTKVGIKEKPLNVKTNRVMEIPKVVNIEVENRPSSLDELSSVNSSSADHLTGWCSELYSTLYEDASMHENQEVSSKENKCESDGSVDGTFDKRTEVRLSSCGASPTNSNDMSSSHKRVSIIRPFTNGDRRCCDADISDEVIVSKLDSLHQYEPYHNFSVIRVTPFVFTGQGDATASNESGIQHGDGDRLKLEETCVMVNGDEAHFTPRTKGKGRPSKKKIRDTLSLRRKPARAREYEQLAVWYAGDTVPSVEDNGSLETGHICESEWELL